MAAGKKTTKPVAWEMRKAAASITDTKSPQARFRYLYQKKKYMKSTIITTHQIPTSKAQRTLFNKVRLASTSTTITAELHSNAPRMHEIKTSTRLQP
jgi:hypothetical protein